MSTTPTKPVKPITSKRKNSGYRNNNNTNSNRKVPPKNSQTPMPTGVSRQKHQDAKTGENIYKNDFLEEESTHEITVQIFPFAIGIAAVYILICFLMNDAKDDVGGIGVFIKNAFYGMFSNVAFLLPFMMGSIAFFYKKDLSSGFLRYRLIFSGVCLVLYSSLAHLFSDVSGSLSIALLFNNGKNYTGGGAVGGILAEVLTRCIGTIGAGILIISLSVTFSIFLFGYTPIDVIKFAAALIRDYRKSRQQGFVRELIIKRREGSAFKMKTHKYRISSHAVYANSVGGHNYDDDCNREDKAELSKDNILGKAKPRHKQTKNVRDNPANADSFIQKPEPEKLEEIEEIILKPKSEPVWFPEKSFFEPKAKSDGDKKNKGEIYSHPDILDDVDDIFFNVKNDIDIETEIELDARSEAEDMDLLLVDSLKTAKTVPAMRGDIPETESAETKSRELTFETTKVFDDYGDNLAAKEYKLPPLSYLTKDTNTHNVDVSGELAHTASRLIETLESFGVKTKVSAVSRGPSVTRYEVTPNSGVKVKSIVNLVDDIALNLASGGVRIEAPIPGKAAVGVEVPNKSVSTVYLRTLLEDSQFRQAASKITVALGMDVAGNPIYSDISKMPHLLIAGATGMGKSVCINSIITSVLYKAKPSEVKLMLIDPKKVELTVYNGIPHLLIPVVSDPKKAAGSLNWAVAEMENRFLLIEEKGVRDLKSYNDAVANDPIAEKIPQIIIIIDELADLMMTAPADVEQSICRLAQKARAAGMHLIIGTQRPSVDVITGLIKANIPSRIAFTVASQIDSRTIIDAKGAEELIGRGDMLYLPVGAAKPMRVQGAYVSEKDVMNVTEFLKKQSDGGYDENILSKIEQEAQKCNTKGAKLVMKENNAE